MFGDTTLTQANAGSSPTDNDFLVSVGKNDVMRIFRFGDNAADKPQLSDVGASSLTNPYTSGSPVITSNGDDPSSAVIWEVHAGGESGAGSELDAYAFGSLVGAFLAARRGTWIEMISLPAVLASRALPEFWLGMVLLAIFSFSFGWFPAGGATSPGASFPNAFARYASLDYIRHLVLPALTLAISGCRLW